jgi:SAM-dependent methyltransferase
MGGGPDAGPGTRAYGRLANSDKETDMAYQELKERQSVMWGNGPYQRVTETLSDIHERVIERLAPGPDVRWLDLACGTGAVAELAAAAGATVTGIDLAPALIDTARERAAAEELEIDYQVGDCEVLGIPDASFDAVSSTCGVMFAPDHEASARELARVTRPGGRIALANWTPTGGLARMFAVMRPFLPAPPPSNPFDWGDERRVRELLGDAFELDIEEHVSTLRIPSGEAYWELFSTSYGPTRTLADSLGARRAELQRDWVDFFETNYRVNGEIAHTREYLLVVGERR